MAIIVGSVAVDVVPDIGNFTRDARAKLVPEADRLGHELGQRIGISLRRELSTELKRIPDIRLGVDDRQVKTKVAGARREIRSLNNETARPNIDPRMNQSKLDEIRVELGDVADRAYSVNIGADDKRLTAKLSLIKSRLEELNQKIARPELDFAGYLKAKAEIDRLSAEVDEFGHKRATAQLRVNTSNSERGMRRLIDLAIGFSPAIVQAGVIAGGVVAALGSSLAIAGAGIGIVAVAARGAASLMKKDLQQLKTDNAKLAAAQKVADNAKGPKARAAALKNVAAAQAQVNALTKAMGPAEAKMLDDTTKIKQVWDTWLRKIAIPGLQPIVSTFKGELPRLLHDITPLFEGAAKGIHGFEQDAFKAFRSPFWQQFFDFLGKRAGPIIRSFGRILINSVTGLAGLIQALDPLGQHYIGTLEKLSARFAHFGTSSRGSASFHSFLQFVKDNGPSISNFLKSLAQFIVDFAKASAGIGAAELKALTGVLTTMSNFATKHPQMAAMAVAVFTLSRAVKALKLVAVGGWIANLAKLGAAQLGIGAATGAAGAGGAAGGAAKTAGKTTAAAGFLAPLAAALPALIAGAVLRGIDLYERGKHPTYGSVANRLDQTNPFGTGTGQNNVIAGTFSRVFSSVLDLFFDKKGSGGGRKPPRSTTTLADAQKIPLKVLISGDAIAAQKLLRIQKITGGIPKNKDIRIGTPGVEGVQSELANVILATHGLPPQKVIKVSSPGGNLTALSLLNISRLARGLPPVKKINISSPGVTGALSNINNLAHQMGLLPPKKSIATSAPGARTAILDMINLDRRAHGLPPLKKIPTSAPGADKAVQQYIALARRAELIPKEKRINLSAPGASKAYDQLTGLLHRSNLLPKNKHIPTDVPGAQASILKYIQLYEKAHHLPISKKIPTSAPGGNKAIQQFIDLARRAGILPKEKHINTSTPGAVRAYGQLNTLLHNANVLPKGKKIPTDVPGATKSILTFINLKRKADNLPPLKKIPTSAPGADHSIQQAIALARKIGLIPNKHSTDISTPGSAAAQAAIDHLRNQLENFPKHFATTISATGNVSFGGTTKGFGAKAAGGLITGPGGPRDDMILSWLSNHEYVQPAHVVAREGVANMDALRAGTATIIPRFAAGGSVFNINEKTRNLGSIQKGLLSHDQQAAVAAVKDLFSSGFGFGGGGGGASSWIPVVATALAMLGQPTSLAPAWARTVIANESGGNAFAVNRYDANAKRGTPSVGGNQVIGPTFRAYAGPFAGTGPFIAGVSVNRLANTYAALNYALHAYGSILNTPGIRSLGSGGGYRPYALGGSAKANTPIVVGEHGREVFTPAVAGYITPHNELGGDVHIDVWIGNEKITDIARVEVKREGDRQGKQLVAGRRVVR